MMLPYLEQQPIYNACNFSVVNQGYGSGIDGAMNSTATSHDDHRLPLPVVAPAQRRQLDHVLRTPYPNTNYFASVGSSLCQYGGNPAGVAFQDGNGNSAAPNGMFEVFGPVVRNRRTSPTARRTRSPSASGGPATASRECSRYPRTSSGSVARFPPA